MITEAHMREIAQRIVSLLEHLRAGTVSDGEEFGDDPGMAAYTRGCLFTRVHDLAIIRRELADYLDETCGCGEPFIGRDIHDAPICGSCAALAVQAIEDWSEQC